jgi:tetratricopeptide (TPR) repeat protein
MKRPCKGLAVAALSSALALPIAPALADGTDAGQEALLRNAQMWASRNRLDLARQSVDKLLALDPDAPAALALLGDIALRGNRADEAQRILAQLRARHPGHSATADLATLVRVHGPDREKLGQMRLLAQMNRKAETLERVRAGHPPDSIRQARELARALFPDGPPSIGGLAAEYWQVMGNDARTAPQAASALHQLYQRTGDADYRLAQLEMQAAQGASALALVRACEALADDPAANPHRLRDLWRRALGRLEGAAAAPRLQAYLQRYPDDRPMAEQLDTARQAVAQAERWARDPARLAQAAGQRELDAGDLAQAEQQWQAALALRPRDAASLGGLGLVRLRQGRHEEARVLFAQAQSLSPQARWQGLEATAHFWGLLRQADDAAQAGRLEEAARQARQAVALEPAHAEALATLAGIRARQDDPAQAQALYERALAADPAHLDALRGLAALHARAGRAPQALALLEAAQRSHPDRAPQLAAVRADLLAEQAEAQRTAGHPGTALRLLEDAVALTPRDPWLRHRLARVYLQLGQPREALDAMDEGIALQGDEADMRYARALIRSATDDDAGALADLEHVSPEQRSDSMRALLRSATVRATVARAAGSDAAQAGQLLAQAERQAGDDADLLFTVANAWFQRGEGAQGVAVFDRLAGRAPATPEARLEHAALMGRAAIGRAAMDGPLAELLPALLAEPGWTPAQAARLSALQAAHLERRVEAAVAVDDRAGALRLAQSPLYGGDAPAVRGRLLFAAQDYAGAARQLAQALDTQGDDAGVRLALGDALARQGQAAQARAQAQWLRQHLDARDAGAQLALLRLWQRVPAMDEARALAQQLLQRFPQDTSVLLHAARLERADDAYAPALAYFRQAQALETNPQEQGRIAQDIHAIEARRQAWVEVGMERLQKNSTAGISTLRGWEIPAVAWMPRGYDGHHFLHVDQVRLDAGPLPPSAQDAAGYGQVAAWPEAAYPAAPGTPRGDGANVGFGYRGRGVEWDVGAIGIGMPVTNLVGGIARSEWREDFSWRAELSRRPLTGSLLSYAGVRDPITGQAWGGVVATGVSGRVSRPWAGYGTSLSAGYALLQGRNVRDNTRLQLRAAIDRDVLRTPHQTVNVGAALSWWSYARDLSEFTWGHGGYYSPRRYLSLSLPVEWGGRKGAFTWLLRGSVSVSRSASRASDYYPGSPALQAQAVAQGHAPVYAGGGSSGFGRSLRVAVEYQATPNWALGAQLSLDRSAYYAPTTLALYLRFALDPVRMAPPERPRPVQPYSGF